MSNRESAVAVLIGPPEAPKHNKNDEIDVEDEEEELLPPFVEVSRIIPVKTVKEWNDNAIQQCFQLALDSFVTRDNDGAKQNVASFNPGEIKYEDTMDVDDEHNAMVVDKNEDENNRWKPSELPAPTWTLVGQSNQSENNK